LIYALTSSAIYLAVALGLVLIFGVTDILNFAHGALITLAAFAVVLLQPKVGVPGAIVISILGVGAIAGLMYYGGFRFTIGNHLQGLGLSLGLLTIFTNYMIYKYSTLPRSLQGITAGYLSVPGGRIDLMRLWVPAGLAVVVALFWLVLRRSWIGLALRACGSDGDQFAASSIGLPPRRVGFYAFIASGIFAAIAGVAITLLSPITPSTGQDYLLEGFVVVVIGGMGSVGGAVVAALALGIIETFGERYISATYSDLYGYAFMIILLLVMPDGLFGRAARRAG
jgi:branched-chain amino acid transport system permease protein